MTTADSPVGSTVRAEVQGQRRQSPRYREADGRLAPFEQLARLVIMRRAELGLSHTTDRLRFDLPSAQWLTSPRIVMS